MDRADSKKKIETLVQTFHAEKRVEINEAETQIRDCMPLIGNSLSVQLISTYFESVSPEWQAVIGA